MPQPQSWPQHGFNDVQMLQQHLMFKQLQELQRRQQLQQLGDARQHGSLNQLSPISKRGTGGQFRPMINGTIYDASGMAMVGNLNWVQHGVSQALQGIPNGMAYAHEQNLAMHGLVQQEIDLYGTPIASTKGTLNQYSQLQGISHDPANMLTKAGGIQADKPMIQSLPFSNSLLGDQFNSEQVGILDGTLLSKHGYQEKNLLGQAPFQGINNGVVSENLQMDNALQRNALGQQEQSSWPGLLQEKTTSKLGPPQTEVPLDPMEEKILYNMDGNIWDAFGRQNEMSGGGYGNAVESTCLLNSFPSIQSGSWSALMQSAVAEASSSDTGVQEEWSGLSFQNTELSTSHQPTNITDSGKQEVAWVDINLQNASINSKPFTPCNDANLSPGFPGFQQPGFHFSLGHKEGASQDSLHVQKPLKSADQWLDGRPHQKPPLEDRRQIQQLEHLVNAWPHQNHEHSDGGPHQQNDRKDAQIISFADVQHLSSTRAKQQTSQHMFVNPLDYMKQVDMSMKFKGNESKDNYQHQPSNSHQGLVSSYKGAGETLEQQQQQNCYQRENSSDSYNSNASQHTFAGRGGRQAGFLRVRKSQPGSTSQVSQGSSTSEQEHSGQGPFHELQGGAKAYEVHSRDIDGRDGPDVTAQTSQNMLELLPKVDHPAEQSPITYYDSSKYCQLMDVPEAQTVNISNAQHQEQPSPSQGFLLGLAPPYQRISHSNSSMPSPNSQQTAGTPSLGLSNPEVKVKDQIGLPLPSLVQSFTPGQDSSGKESWPEKSDVLAQTAFGNFNLSNPANFPGSFAFAPSHLGNQLQKQHVSNAILTNQSLNTAIPGKGQRFPPFNLVPSPDSSNTVHNNPFGQRFPVLEAVPVSQPPGLSRASQQVSFSAKPDNVWTTASNRQDQPSAEFHKHPPSLHQATDHSFHVETTSSAPQDLDTLNLQSRQSSMLGASLAQSQGFDVEEAQPGKQRSEHEGLTDIHDIDSQRGALSKSQESMAKSLSDANAISSGSSVQFNRVQHNYSLPYHVQNMINMGTGPNVVLKGYSEVNCDPTVQQLTTLSGQQFSPTHNNVLGRDMNSATQQPLYASGERKVLSFLPMGREDNMTKPSSVPVLEGSPSQMMVPFHQNDPQGRSNSSCMSSNSIGQPQIDLQISPAWFKHYGMADSGQMSLMRDMRNANTVPQQLSLRKPADSHASFQQVHVGDACQTEGIRPAVTAHYMAGENLSTPCVRPTDGTDCSFPIPRPKKRKTATSELQPWHAEVIQRSQWLPTRSLAEANWAQAMRRRIEKVEDEAEMIEDVQSTLRSKRRLILLTQLMQQLLRPPPAILCSADANTFCDSVAFFVAKLVLGDACALICSVGTDSHPPPDRDMYDSTFMNFSDTEYRTSETHKTSERCVDKYLLDVVDAFTSRAKKLEDEVSRLEGRASIPEVRFECQELEKFSVMNRFAKFHSKPQVDGSKISGTARACPQRYVTALPMPRMIPEGVHCLSL
ncbi:hypothetical protein RJ641_006695 [Dillenia turbinata]|uniref:Uncharacterized protein n=1 Tax=Dillenia turbinata TaxID=194707 RepID=A0AAN8V7C6_9MAGN